MSALPSIREQLHNIANNLPEEATWEEVLDSVLVCQAVARGMADIAAGRTIPADQVKEYLAQRRRARETAVEQRGAGRVGGHY